MPSFRFVREVAASPELVFGVLTDHRGYAGIAPIRKVELECEGVPAPNGVGAIRVLHSVGPPLREEVIAFQPPERFAYRLLSGAPLRDHVGAIALEAAGAGSKVTYAVRTTPTLPLGNAAVLAITKAAVKRLLDGLLAEAERRAKSSGS
jgi:hypothetical protein